MRHTIKNNVSVDIIVEINVANYIKALDINFADDYHNERA